MGLHSPEMGPVPPYGLVCLPLPALYLCWKEGPGSWTAGSLRTQPDLPVPVLAVQIPKLLEPQFPLQESGLMPTGSVLPGPGAGERLGVAGC